jgi:hypothetical protein
MNGFILYFILYKSKLGMTGVQYKKFTEDDLEIDTSKFDDNCVMMLFQKCNERIESIGRYMINFYKFTGEYWGGHCQTHYDAYLCYVCVAVDNYGEFVTGIIDDIVYCNALELEDLVKIKPKITYNSFDYKEPKEYDTNAMELPNDLIDLVCSTNYTLQLSDDNRDNIDNIVPLMTNFFVPYLRQVRKLSGLNHNNLCP